MSPARWRNELVVIAVLLALLPLLPGRLPAGIVGLGVVSGAVLALHAVGVVLVHRAYGVVNFAQVQIGAVGATLFVLLVNAGGLVRGVQAVCPPCLERETAAIRNVTYVVALLAGLALAVLLGWLVDRAVVRRFDRAPRLVLTVATVFVVQALLAMQSVLFRALTTEDQRARGGMTNAVPPPWRLDLRINPARFGTADVLLVVAAVAAVVLVALYLRRTASGRAVRATADNPDRARTLGLDVERVRGRVWLLAGTLSGVTAVLLAMTTGAGDGETGTPAGLLVRILAVAVLARFASLPMALAGGVVLGVVEQSVRWAYGSTGPFDAALVLVVAALLLPRRAGRSRLEQEQAALWRSTRELRPIPAELRGLDAVRAWRRAGVLALVVVLTALPFLLSPSQTSLASYVLVQAMVGMSLLVLTGWAGQVSLGQFALAAVGAWIAGTGVLPFALALPAAALAGAGVAVLVGLPALRLRGLMLAVTTLAFALAVPALLLDPDRLGSHLDEQLPRPVLLGVRLDDSALFYAFMLLLLVAVVAAVAGLRRSRFARVLLAAREDEATAQTFGIDLVRARLLAFAVSGAIAALAGAALAYEQGGVKAELFAVDRSLDVFVVTVIGGLGAVWAPLLGFGYSGVLTVFSSSPLVAQLATGAAGLVLLLLAPGGLAELAARVRDGALRRLARRHGLRVPSLLADSLDEHGEQVVPIAPRLRGGPPPARYGLDGQWAQGLAVEVPGGEP